MWSLFEETMNAAVVASLSSPCKDGLSFRDAMRLQCRTVVVCSGGFQNRLVPEAGGDGAFQS